jgi:threonine dehydrogenase-like Zn-dependent dehydrogenase
MGADRTATPETVGEVVCDADLALELSGQPSTLDDAIGVVGYDSRIVVGSWYGTKRAPIDLGGRFHRDRIDLISSQVSTISPSLRGRWDHDRRLDEALGWLDRIDADALITHRIPFERASTAYELLDSEAGDAVQIILEYGES